MVQKSSTPPAELFGCYSPRNATNPVGELFHELAGMMSGSAIGMQVWGAAPSWGERRSGRLESEAIVQEVHVQPSSAVQREVISRQEVSDGESCERTHVGVEAEAESVDGVMQQLVQSPASLGEHVVVDDDDVGLPTDQGEAGQLSERAVVVSEPAGSGQEDLEMDMGAAPCPLSGFLARITAPIEEIGRAHV